MPKTIPQSELLSLGLPNVQHWKKQLRLSHVNTIYYNECPSYVSTGKPISYQGPDYPIG